MLDDAQLVKHFPTLLKALKAQLLSYIDAHTGAFIARLSEAVAIPSITVARSSLRVPSRADDGGGPCALRRLVLLVASRPSGPSVVVVKKVLRGCMVAVFARLLLLSPFPLPPSFLPPSFSLLLIVAGTNAPAPCPGRSRRCPAASRGSQTGSTGTRGAARSSSQPRRSAWSRARTVQRESKTGPPCWMMRARAREAVGARTDDGAAVSPAALARSRCAGARRCTWGVVQVRRRHLAPRDGVSCADGCRACEGDVGSGGEGRTKLLGTYLYEVGAVTEVGK
ncbi:hypothetical protein FB451DRAFT_1562378 [Mycena latifolia]|nr:hypothetical protein FB451DRAFT_1562378 [Mycena latifolia]